MDNQIQIIAEAAARLLLQRFQEEDPAWMSAKVPLDEIITRLGLQVETFHPDDYPRGTYGFMDPDDDENLIWLCRSLPETSRRFTLAHELGHAVLHCHGNVRIQALLGNLSTTITVPELSREDPCCSRDVQEDMGGLFDDEQFHKALGIGGSYDPRSQRELAANIFAAELLMPLERVRTLYLEQCVPPHTLAATFGVSNVALLNRLTSLLKAPRGNNLLTAQQSAPQSKTTQIRPAKQYDEFQQAAIAAPTPALIVAGPGSGKTSTLIGRIEYMIRTLSLQAQHILALTFSRKATEEMEERLRLTLVKEGYALPKVSTFHAFCADLLRQHGTLVGLHEDFALIDEAEGYFLLRQLANEMQLRHYLKLQSPTYYFPDLLQAISRAKDELVSPEEYSRLAKQMKGQAKSEEELANAERALEVAHIYALYQEALLRRGDTDFGGLLMLSVQLLQQHPEVLREQQEKYQQILVDEFQDVNRASGVLLRVLAGAAQRVWVVGDAQQAIYGFRGASSANISQFATDFPGALVLSLSRNYRSRPDLVAMAESFRCWGLEPGQGPAKNQSVRPLQSETYITLAKATNDSSELAGLVQDIRSKYSNGYSYNDMAVLCRTRAQAQKVTSALSAADLPVVEQGSMLEQEHSKDVISLLLLLSNPSGVGLLRVARQHEHPLLQEDIEALLIAARVQNSNPRSLIFSGEAPPTMSVAGRGSLKRLSEIMQSLQYAPDIWSLLAQYLFMATSLVRNLLLNQESKQYHATRTDYDRLLQLARHYDQQQPNRPFQQEEQGSLSMTLEERVKGFLEYLSLLVLLRQDGGSDKSAEERGMENTDVIRVMTVHASKGLEFPVIYLPGLVQRRFPLQSRSSPIVALQGIESVGSATHESSESCLFYVGITRARDHLILSYSERYGKQKYKRSPYLDALEAGLSGERLSRLLWEGCDDEEALPVAHPVNTSSQPSEHFIKAMKPTTLRTSAIEAYQRCPRQYAYSIIYHFTCEADSYQLFWQATQQTIEALRKRHQEASNGGEAQAMPTQQELQELYTERWQALEGHSAPFAPLYEEHGHEVLAAIRHKLLSQEEMIWHTHAGFHVAVAGKTVYVTVDRVENPSQPGQPARFIRTRFGKHKQKPSVEIRDLFYALAYRQFHPRQNVELYSHNLSTNEVIPIKITAKKEQGLYDEIERIILGIERNEYPARPDAMRCSLCPFFFICPA